MAGFGSAFAQSFNQENDRIAQAKEDTFKLHYADYISQRDYRQKIDLENKKAMNLAKSLVASTPGQPAEAWQATYNNLVNGSSPEAEQKRLQDYQATVNTSATTKPGEGTGVSSASSAPSGQTPDPRNDLSSAAQSSVSSQMAASGMQQPQGGGIFGKVKQGLHDVFSADGQNQRMGERANQRVAATAGVPQQQVTDTIANANTPSTPLDGVPGASVQWSVKPANWEILRSKVNTLGDAIALHERAKTEGNVAHIQESKSLVDAFMHEKATEANLNAESIGQSFKYARGFIKGPDGKYDGSVAMPNYHDGELSWVDHNGKTLDPGQVTPVDKNMETDIKNVSDEMVKPVQDYQSTKNDTKQLIRLSSDISKLAKQHPEAMGASGNISQFTDAFKRAGVNVAVILNPNFDPNKPVNQVDPGVFGELEKAEKATNGMLKGVTDRNAQNAYYATLMDIQATRLAYMWAKDQGQTGRGVSNADFNHFKDVAMGGGNPAALQKSASDFLAQKLKSVQDQEATLGQGGSAGTYFKQKYQGVPLPWDVGTTMDQEIKSDPELQQSMDYVNAGQGPDLSGQVDTTSKTPIPPEVAKSHPDITQDVWDIMVEQGTDKLFTGAK